APLTTFTAPPTNSVVLPVRKGAGGAVLNTLKNVTGGGDGQDSGVTEGVKDVTKEVTGKLEEGANNLVEGIGGLFKKKDEDEKEKKE
ncbi:MAG: hypothetical protein AAF492_05450, partial [Verrucomicrobiota bacterium]